MKNKNTLSTRKILWKALCMGLRVKTPISLLVSILAIPAALIPLLLSKQLQHITDLMVSVATARGAVLADVVSAFLLLGVLGEDNENRQKYITLAFVTVGLLIVAVNIIAAM